MIDKDVKVGESPAPKVFAEIAGGETALKSVETDDRSAPAIEAGTVVKPSPAPAVFAEIAAKKTGE